MSQRVKVFLDTSVLIAANDIDHERHAESRPLLAAATPRNCACGGHSLAETYANLSIVKGGRLQRPETALRLVEQIASRMMVVTLTPDEYISAIQGAAKLRVAGETIYDALLLKCARKVGAERIYTWNVRHFQLVAPDLTGRIVTP
ncbi:MAG: PIN domain-containing protein [Terracidiphilus sp.]